jgi:hypothetical protein
MKLPIELRIDVYERVFNASLDDDLLPDPLKHVLMRKAMLCILNIDRTIRNESQEVCIGLATRHLKALEASIIADKITHNEAFRIGMFSPPVIDSPHFRQYWERYKGFAGLAEKISYDANKVIALYELLRILNVAYDSRLHVPWLNVLRHLHLAYRGGK